MKTLLNQTERYLRDKLLPFWTARIVEPKFGGFQTNYDRDGRRTAVTHKTLLCQGRSIFTLSHALRLGYDWPGARDMIRQGVDFLFRHFRDPEFDGYYWIVTEDGRPEDDSKVIYGHAFLIYALSEHAIVTGEERSRQEACRLFDLLAARAADFQFGGFFEHFDRRFQRVSVRPDGVFDKSLDVHMHLMEAFTTLFELTRSPRHEQALRQVSGLIFTRMLDPEIGVGTSMYAPDWRPIANVQLGTVWGSDRFGPAGKPPEITSYGHNIELAWLYLHSLDVLGVPREQAIPRVQPIFEHTVRDGIDREFGGVYVEGHRVTGPTETNKEFWQQAEALVGLLDAYLLLGEPKYLEAFGNVHDFVFTKMIHWEQGEWFPLLSREGKVLWDYMGHDWKICYHTIRSMLQTVRRLRLVVAGETIAGGQPSRMARTP